MPDDNLLQTRRSDLADRRSRLTLNQREALAARLTQNSPVAAKFVAQHATRGPLSAAQERLWVMEVLAEGSGLYNEYAKLDVEGALSLVDLEASFQELVDRHPSLRTSFVQEPDLLQVIAPSIRIGLDLLDCRYLPGQAVAQVCELAGRAITVMPFDRSTPPLLRVAVLWLADEAFSLIIVNHHLISDARSRQLLMQELAECYARRLTGREATNPRPVMSYLDYVAWRQAQVVRGEDEVFWQGALADCPPVSNFAPDAPPPPEPSGRGGRRVGQVPAAVLASLKRAAGEQGATLFTALLAVTAIWLRRHTGQDDIVIGTPVANCGLSDFEPVVGLFIDTVPVRIRLPENAAFEDVLNVARLSWLEVTRHQSMSFQDIVQLVPSARAGMRAPLFQVLVNFRSGDTRALCLPGAVLRQAPLHNGLARNELELDLSETPDGTLDILCDFDSDLFVADAIDRRLGDLIRILEEIAGKPGTKLSTLLAPSSSEQQLRSAALDGPNSPVSMSERLVPRLLKAVKDFGDRPAVSAGDQTLSYGQLGAYVAGLTEKLRQNGVGPGERVALCLERDARLPAAIAAVFCRGAAYVPIEPDAPIERTRLMLSIAKPRLVVVSTGASATYARSAGAEALLELDNIDPEDLVTTTPLDALISEQAQEAYVIFTSGSTGRPKGVSVDQSSLANFLVAMDRVLDAETPGVWLATTSASFDISILELLWTLSRGYHVVVDALLARPDARHPRRNTEVSDFSLSYFASGQSEDGYHLIVRTACWADENGFGALWLPERHFHAFGGLFPSPAVLAAHLAGRTRRIALRAGSVVLPLHDPLRIAEEWSMVDNLSDGRVGVSFAPGWHKDDFVLAREPFQERHATMLRDMEVVRRLWRGEAIERPNGDGQLISVTTLPRPVQPDLPCWLTSSGNVETFATAGRLGVNLLTHLLGQSVAELAEKIEVYRTARREAGHAGHGRVSVMVHTYVATDVEDVAQTGRAPFRSYLRGSISLLERIGAAQGLDFRDLTPEDLEALLEYATDRYLDQNSLICPADLAAERIRAIRNAGVDEICCLVDFGLSGSKVIEGLERLKPLARVVGASEARADSVRDMSLAQLIRHYRVTHMQCTPTAARILVGDPELSAGLADLKHLLVGGEALDPQLLLRLRDFTNARIDNMYGPTETTIWSGSAQIEPMPDTISIGTPLLNYSYRVVDSADCDVPPNVAGELLIGGVGVASGYIDDPVQTAERFDGPDADGKRWYRTGDRVRWRGDGNIAFLGRVDDQIKLRGYRIELGEIEAAVLALPGVSTAAVCFHPTSEGGELAAYVTRTAGATLAEHDLGAALSAHLPAYMTPARWTLLDRLPQLPNGKVDRKALQARSRSVPKSSPEPRVGDQGLIKRLTALWEDVLGAATIGPDDNFFQIGGHSLLATKLVVRLRREFGVEVSLRALLEAPTIRGLAQRLKPSERPDDHEDRLRPAPEDRYLPFPLTDVQQAYWIGRRGVFELGQVACHLYVELEFRQLDVERLSSAWRQVVERHDMLRAVILEDGRQQILPTPRPYEISVTDVRGYEPDDAEAGALAVREAMSHQVLDSARWPLFDIQVSRLPGETDRIHFSIDTLIADGASSELALREWLETYIDGNVLLPPEPVSFRDFVLWERRRQDAAAVQRAQDYWRPRLPNLPNGPDLPLAIQPSDLTEPRFRRREHWLTRSQWSMIQARAAEYEITASALLLAAYASVLATWSASDSFCLNLTLFNRGDGAPELASIVGDFTELSLLEVEGALDGTFVERVRRLQATLWSDLDHRAVSGVWVARELARTRGRGAYRAPVVFTSELGVAADGARAALRTLNGAVTYTITQTPQVWLDHQVREEDGELFLSWDAVENLFPPSVLDDMFKAYTELLLRLATDETAWIEPAPDYRPERHKACIRKANETAGPAPTELIHNPFLRIAQETPDRTAVIGEDRILSYGELEARSRALALSLKASGAATGDVVGVWLDRGWRQAVAALGVTRAGMAYLPLDTTHPAQRVESVLQEARTACVIKAGHEGLPADKIARRDMIWIDLDEVEADPGSGTLDPYPVTPSSLAYVIFTSGSTGRPKGVEIEHAAALNTIMDINHRFGVGSEDTILSLSALGFDLSAYDLFGLLAVGGAVVWPGVTSARSPTAWETMIVEHGVTVWNTVPAIMSMLAENVEGRKARSLERLRLIMLSGDWIPVDLPVRLRALSPTAKIVSLGGATEASIWSVYYEIDEIAPSWASIPYGLPLMNQTTYVLDAGLRARPIGLPGELHIGGRGLARGYRNRPDLNTTRFVIHPITGERLYKTGDMAMWRAEGDLRLLGRLDDQVKISGYRVELGEIETVAEQAEGILRAVAAVHVQQNSRKIVLFVRSLLEERAEVLETRLKAWLVERLPGYMTPQRVVAIDQIPLSANGKVDRPALVALLVPDKVETAIIPEHEAAGGQNAFGQAVAEIWRDVLGLAEVDPTIDFFAAGGDSIELVRVARQIQERLGISLDLLDLFEAPTVTEQAAIVARKAREIDTCIGATPDE